MPRNVGIYVTTQCHNSEDLDLKAKSVFRIVTNRLFCLSLAWLFPWGVKRPGREAHHTSASSA